MIDLGTVYLAVTGALLLVALGAGLHVLRGIVREGLDLRRRRRTGEVEKYTEDEEYGPGPPDDSDDPTATCPRCGAANEQGFDYCRRCAAPLGPGS